MSRSSRRVLVVGGTGLLGVALARALAVRGDRVIVTARDEGKLASIVEELHTLGAGPHAYVCADLLIADAPERIREGVMAAGGVDDVILACGPAPRGPIDDLNRDDLERALAAHAIAPLLLLSLLAPALRASQGAIIALSDAGVQKPYPNHLAYLTAKGAQQAGLAALAVELAPYVRVNLLALGIVESPEADGDPLRMHRLHSRSLLGRFGTPTEVVHATLSLLDATWASGETWGIGRLARPSAKAVSF